MHANPCKLLTSHHRGVNRGVRPGSAVWRVKMDKEYIILTVEMSSIFRISPSSSENIINYESKWKTCGKTQQSLFVDHLGVVQLKACVGAQGWFLWAGLSKERHLFPYSLPIFPLLRRADFAVWLRCRVLPQEVSPTRCLGITVIQYAVMASAHPWTFLSAVVSLFIIHADLVFFVCSILYWWWSSAQWFLPFWKPWVSYTLLFLI